MEFEIIGAIQEVELIATGREISESPRLRKNYGGQRWRKLKGVALVRLADDTIRKAEIHWYEAHGVDKKESKIKRYLD